MKLELSLFFFFNDTATTEIYTLSLHDALPICRMGAGGRGGRGSSGSRASCASDRTSHMDGSRYQGADPRPAPGPGDRKSTRLNSSHANISYAVFCLKKKKNKYHISCLILRHNY